MVGNVAHLVSHLIQDSKAEARAIIFGTVNKFEDQGVKRKQFGGFPGSRRRLSDAGSPRRALALRVVHAEDVQAEQSRQADEQDEDEHDLSSARRSGL